MMMVLGEILGKLEAGELVVGRDPADHARGLEIDQVSIRRTAREVGKPVRNVTNTHRMTDRHEQVDDGSATWGVTLIDASEACLDQGMQVVGHPLR